MNGRSRATVVAKTVMMLMLAVMLVVPMQALAQGDDEWYAAGREFTFRETFVLENGTEVNCWGFMASCEAFYYLALELWDARQPDWQGIDLLEALAVTPDNAHPVVMLDQHTLSSAEVDISIGLGAERNGDGAFLLITETFGFEHDPVWRFTYYSLDRSEAVALLDAVLPLKQKGNKPWGAIRTP